jgi:hypothetical protein
LPEVKIPARHVQSLNCGCASSRPSLRVHRWPASDATLGDVLAARAILCARPPQKVGSLQCAEAFSPWGVLPQACRQARPKPTPDRRSWRRTQRSLATRLHSARRRRHQSGYVALSMQINVSPLPPSEQIDLDTLRPYRAISRPLW